MRILLDRCVPARFALDLAPHEVVHAGSLVWGEAKDPNLIIRATEDGFDVLITADRQMPHQTRRQPDSLPVLVVRVVANNRVRLARAAPRVLAVLADLPRGEFTILDARDL